MSYICGCFAVLNYSDPLRDPSYRSKAILCGALIASIMIVSALGITDAWRYFDRWENKSNQIVLQVCCNSLLSHGQPVAHVWIPTSLFVKSELPNSARASATPWSACVYPCSVYVHAAGALDDPVYDHYQLHTLRACCPHPACCCHASNDEKLPDIAPHQDEAQQHSAPVATVIRTPSDEDPADTTPPDAHVPTTETVVRPASNNPLYTDKDPIMVDCTTPQEATGGPVAEGYKNGEKLDAADDAGMPQKASAVALEVEGSVEDVAAASNSSRGGGGWNGYFRRLWDSVREDPRAGFRYSSITFH